MAAQAGERRLGRWIGAALEGRLRIGRIRQLRGDAVEEGSGLGGLAKLQPAFGQRAQKPPAFWPGELVPAAPLLLDDKLEVADGKRRQPIRSSAVERSHV